MSYSIVQRSSDVVTLVRGLTSADPLGRSTVVDVPIEWIGMGILDGPAQVVVGQIALWAWNVEEDADVRHDLLESVNAMVSAMDPAHIVALFQAVDRATTGARNDEMLSDIDEFLLEHPAVHPRALSPDACRRAIDLARGITSTDARERFNAARLAADVVASRELTDEEAECFAGLLSYVVVIEPDPAVRRDQAAVLGIAAHHGRLSGAHREIALAGDLDQSVRAALTDP